MTNMTRLEMIKAAAEKIERRKALAKKFGGTSIGKLTRAAETQLEARAAKEKKFDEEIDRLNDNTHLYWNDASKFAEKYYGETYRETTKFDNEWD